VAGFHARYAVRFIQQIMAAGSLYNIELVLLYVCGVQHMGQHRTLFVHRLFCTLFPEGVRVFVRSKQDCVGGIFERLFAGSVGGWVAVRGSLASQVCSRNHAPHYSATAVIGLSEVVHYASIFTPLKTCFASPFVSYEK
jgi:hypothetical protein